GRLLPRLAHELAHESEPRGAFGWGHGRLDRGRRGLVDVRFDETAAIVAAVGRGEDEDDVVTPGQPSDTRADTLAGERIRHAVRAAAVDLDVHGSLLGDGLKHIAERRVMGFDRQHALVYPDGERRGGAVVSWFGEILRVACMVPREHERREEDDQPELEHA